MIVKLNERFFFVLVKDEREKFNWDLWLCGVECLYMNWLNCLSNEIISIKKVWEIYFGRIYGKSRLSIMASWKENSH